MTDNSATATGQQENANLTYIVDFEVKNRGKKPMKARLHYGEKVSLVIDYERGRTIAVVDLTEPLRQVRAKAGSAASAKAIEAERDNVSRTVPSEIYTRVMEMAEKGEVSGQVAYYLTEGRWPKTCAEECGVGEPTPPQVVAEPVPAPEPKPTPKKPESELVGYVRRSRSGGALKISISADAFQRSRRYVSQDGHEYVGLVVSLDKVRSVMNGEREVTSVCQIVDGA